MWENHTGKTIAGIFQPSAGEILFEGSEIGGFSPTEGRALRQRRSIATRTRVPRSIRIGKSVVRWRKPLVIHNQTLRRERQARVREVLAAVGLPETHLDLYPHELSGGQQRRIGLARILMLRRAW